MVIANCRSPYGFSNRLARGVGDWFERERERERWFTGRDKKRLVPRTCSEH
jgi:hypothetical protein